MLCARNARIEDAGALHHISVQRHRAVQYLQKTIRTGMISCRASALFWNRLKQPVMLGHWCPTIFTCCCAPAPIR